MEVRFLHWYKDKVFPWLMKKNIGKQSIMKYRKQAIMNAKGETLEIGIGEGLNLALYPKNIQRITAVDNYVREIKSSDIEVNLVSTSADNLPFNDASFDTVVSTFTLCSVQHLDKVITEIFRVLKPDGQFILLEHGKSKNKLIIILQNVFNPLYNRFAYGCNINRQYQKQLIDCGFSLLTFNIEKAPIYPRLLTGYIYWGVAKKQLNKGE